MPGGLPALKVKGLVVLRDGKQQRDQLACHRAHRFGAQSPVASEQRFVVVAIESAAETPATGEQEELTAEHGTSALRLFLAATTRAAGSLDEIHAGEFKHLSRVLEAASGPRDNDLTMEAAISNNSRRT